MQACDGASVARRILRSLLAEDVAGGGNGTSSPAFPLALFQEEAVRRARAVLARRDGVIVADSVGLGKTFVALALVEEVLRGGGSVVVVVPAALRPTWRSRLQKVREHAAAGGATMVHLLSHARLSRGGYAADRLLDTRLLVVDEAHAFRTPGTRRHRALAALCPRARVVLLTATPVNNRLDDLHHLLRLFAADDAFRDLGIPSLSEAFRADDRGAVRRVVRDAVVRRTRAMLVRRYGAVTVAGDPVRFPRRAPPRVVRYDDPRLTRLVELIGALELPMVSDPAGAAALVRLGLLKRLESGADALRRSVQRQLATTRAFADALSRGRILTARDRPLVAGDGADPCQLILEEVVLDSAPPDLDVRALGAAAARDLVRLRRMSARLRGADPKLDALRRLVAEVPAEERVVVFTEFRDTAEAVWRALLRGHRVGRVDGAGAWMGRRPAGRRTVVERFAPRAAGRPEPPARERVDVLVATDVLAEGLDLQDARHVVCYDLPWNPVRLIQRIGRVDRLGSPHDVVVPHLFVPGIGLEDVLRLTRTLTAKLDRIAGSVATEQAGALLAALAGGAAHAARALSAAETDDDEPMEALRSLWLRELARDQGRVAGCPRSCTRPAAAQQTALQTAPCVATMRQPSSGRQPGVLLLFERPGGMPRLLEVTGGRVNDFGPRAVRAIEAALDGDLDRKPNGAPATGRVPALDLDPASARRTSRSLAAAARAGHRHLAAEAVATAAPPPFDRRGPEWRIALRLRGALHAVGSTPPAPLVRRADAALARLATPLTPAERQAAVRLLERLPEKGAPEEILRAVECALPEPAGADAEPTGPGAFRLVAALEIVDPAMRDS